jgi:hypothetical protein
MNVFVLGTGRCGTVTFSKACGHIRNYTTGHESLVKALGDARFAYPDKHIEVDSRLPWFLGELAQRYPDAFYVHLIRDPIAVAQSIARRWGGRISFARAFGESMLMRGGKNTKEDRLAIARFQARTMTANIQMLLHALPPEQTIYARLENSGGWFPEFWHRIGATGNVDEALAEFDIKYNASRVKP